MQVRPTLEKKFQDLEREQPIKLAYSIQVLESMALKSAFPKHEIHEPLRITTQKLTLAERKTKLINLIDPAFSFKNSTFDNNVPGEVHRILQVT